VTNFEDGAPSSPLDQELLGASRLAEEGEWEEAFELLTTLERDYPEDATLLCMLGLVAGEVDASESAYDYFRRALAAQPEDPYVLVRLGRALARYDDPDAEGVLRLAAVTAPTLPETRLEYGAYLAREGIFDLAIAELKAAGELDPENPRIAREEGVTFLLAGRADLGVEALERAVALDADDSELRLLFGLALVAVDRLEDAAEELVRAGREMSTDADAQLAASLAASSQGWDDEAWGAFARAEAAPAPPDSQLMREVEEALEEEDGAAALLVEEVGPSLLRERLQERD
jgi:Flp pilus assembly protein TadD